MKYLFLLLLLANTANAYDGIVIVLEAPLLREPSLSSTVVQTIRKGERVYIPREYVVDGEIPEFVPTFDRTGNRAYVPGRYVKVITGTVAESRLPISYPGNDPTDYRLEEPIPSTYPFEDKSFLRASVAFMMGNNTKAPYAYNTTFSHQNYDAEMGGRFTVTRKISYDKYDRFYFGFIGLVTSAKNHILFKNNALAEESRGMIRGGPWFTYDAYKSENARLAFGTGFTFNYHKTTLFVDDSKGNSEQRIFTGYSISPMASTTFQLTDILPRTDFVGGLDVALYLPHSLKTEDDSEIPQLWGDNNNQISSGIKAQASLFLGVQVKY